MPRALGLLKETEVRLWYDVMESNRGNSRSGPGAGERATGTVRALTERAPTARKVRAALNNMMIWNVVKNDGTRPDVWEVGEKN